MPDSIIENIRPQLLGMPAYYKDWRPTQATAIDDIINDESRISVIQAPVGVGKSAIAIAAAKLMDIRSVYLTFTKALQDQLISDFAPTGLKLIKGRDNYTCINSPQESVSCEIWGRFCADNSCGLGRHSQCNALDCESWANNCCYRLAYQDAIQSRLVVANYAYWVNVTRPTAPGLGDVGNPVDLLILDEAHNAPDGLCDLLAINFTSRQINEYGGKLFPEDLDNIESWQAWAVQQAAIIAEETQRLAELGRDVVLSRASAEQSRQRDRYTRKIGDILNMQGLWVVEPIEYPHRAWDLKPVHAFQHVESRLFHGIKKVLIMSGTLTPKTIQLMGIAAGNYNWHSYPYMFPKRNAPIYAIKTIALKFTSTPEEKEKLFRTAANIMKQRSNRSGIIHTVSYHLAKEFMLWLRNYDRVLARMCVTHERHNTADIVSEFKKAKLPQILISPSVTTGYDFPQEECEYVIWLKLPFPNMHTPVMQARAARDKSYSGYLMVQELAQGVGRGMRSASDYCESFILDDNWVKWAGKAYAKFLPRYLKIQSLSSVPRPPLSIADRREQGAV